jgi:uncharacterized membrane protein YeaQ/YmgE (transglycosylase-associated protein family)
MTTFAEIILSPGPIIAWMVVGLIVGRIAAWILKSGGSGMVGDIIMGMIGAVIGGLVFGLVTEESGFWGGIVVAIFGA